MLPNKKVRIQSSVGLQIQVNNVTFNFEYGSKIWNMVFRLSASKFVNQCIKICMDRGKMQPVYGYDGLH